MRCVTAVDPFWLAELGPMFFSVKEDWHTRQQHRREQKEALEQQHADALTRQQLESKLASHTAPAIQSSHMFDGPSSSTTTTTKPKVVSTQTFVEVGRSKLRFNKS